MPTPSLHLPSLHANVLLCDGFSNLVLACALEPLRAVRDRHEGKVTWTILTADDGTAHSSSGLRMAPDRPRDEAGRCELLIVVSGYGYREHARPAARRALHRLARLADTLIAVDTGSWLLASAGLLRARAATIHWQVGPEFAETFPSVKARPDRFVRAGHIWTGGGASTALDLMTAFIDERFGTAMAFDVSTLFVHDAARQLDGGRGPGHLNTPETPELHAAINRMVETIERPESLADIASCAGLSLRSLHRQFLTRLGMPPGRYYQSLRLARARDLAETTELSMHQLAARTGFAMPSTLSRAYRTHFGTSVRQVRSERRRCGPGTADPAP